MTFDPGTIGVLLVIVLACFFADAGTVDCRAETKSFEKGICPGETCVQRRLPKDEIPPALVRVVNIVKKPDGTTQQDKGSGAIIFAGGKQFVLTAAHIFREGAGRISVITREGRRYPARLSTRDRSWDVALVQLEQLLEIPSLTFSDEPAGIGDETVAWGFGPDGTAFGRTGTVVGYVRSGKTDSNETLKTTGRAREGDSGGPVLNKRGEAVGLLWGTDGRYTYSTWSGRLRTTINGYLSSEKSRDEEETVKQDDGQDEVVAPPESVAPRPALVGEKGNIVSLRFLDGVARALGFGTPATLLAYCLFRWLAKRKTTETSKPRSEHAKTVSLDDTYAKQLNSLYDLSGHSTAADATLGRLYDAKLREAEQSIDGETVKVAKLLRKQVADQFLRIHSSNPSPVES